MESIGIINSRWDERTRQEAVFIFGSFSLFKAGVTTVLKMKWVANQSCR
jgi:hypothetical protein